MKAIRVRQFGGPEVLQIEEMPVPQPGPGEVLVRVRAAGVNPVETYIRSGKYPRLPGLPYTPGSDAAGTLEPGGQRVYVSASLTGTYAEFCVCAGSAVHPLDERLSYEQGAALGTPYATALRALHRGGAKPNEAVLVHGGSGGVGLAATQLARVLGCHVLATAGSEAGRRAALDAGAAHVADHTREGYEEEISGATGGRGVDLILEMLANVNLGRDLTLLAAEGRVVIIGSRGPVEINPRDAMMRDADIRGLLLANTPPAELAALHGELQRFIATGALRPQIAHTFPLAEAARAHEAILTPGASGKLVLLP